jgi:methionyl-tRNA formyltransferase
MRIGFVTCVQLGLSCMEAIYAVGGKLDLAVTLRDEVAPGKSGRIRLDEFCATRDVPLLKVANINDEAAVGAIASRQLDWLFVIGWSQIVRRQLLGTTRCGVLGMHPTLLPIGRGRAPIPWAIILGLTETGVTLFKLDEGVDSGPIIRQTKLEIGPREDATSLYARVDLAHATLVKSVWRDLVEDRLQYQPQDESRASVWTARKPQDGQLVPGMRVADADKLVRAVTHPYPGAFLPTAEGDLLVWRTGAPNEDCGGLSNAAVRRLHFSDGWLDATHWSMRTP